MEREPKSLYLKFSKKEGKFKLMANEKIFEIFIQDLKEDVQEKLIEFLGGDNGNYDVFPIVTLTECNEDDDEDDRC